MAEDEVDVSDLSDIEVRLTAVHLRIKQKKSK